MDTNYSDESDYPDGRGQLPSAAEEADGAGYPLPTADRPPPAYSPPGAPPPPPMASSGVQDTLAGVVKAGQCFFWPRR